MNWKYCKDNPFLNLGLSFLTCMDTEDIQNSSGEMTVMGNTSQHVKPPPAQAPNTV